MKTKDFIIKVLGSSRYHFISPYHYDSSNKKMTLKSMT